MRSIACELRRRGFNIWIDIDKMHGNISVCMADGIRQSTVVLLFITSQYIKTNAVECRNVATWYTHDVHSQRTVHRCVHGRHCRLYLPTVDPRTRVHAATTTDAQKENCGHSSLLLKSSSPHLHPVLSRRRRRMPLLRDAVVLRHSGENGATRVGNHAAKHPRISHDV